MSVQWASLATVEVEASSYDEAYELALAVATAEPLELAPMLMGSFAVSAVIPPALPVETVH